MDARVTALSALIACRKQNAWSDGSLKEYIVRDRLDRRDAALATRLCYGVLQNRMLLDFYLSAFLKGRMKDLQPVVADILRLGAYQIVFLEKIPASAAVSEAVNETKKYANSRASGLVNAVLRALARAAEDKKLPRPQDLATRYSHPAPLVELLRQSLGDERLEAFLACDNEAPETVVQRNPLMTKGTDLFLELQNQELSIRRHSWLPDCYCLSGTGSIETMRDFCDGKFYVQDAAAHLAALALDAKPGQTVLDACAAPGGKSFTAAIEMQDRGKILACDIHPHKLELIEKGAERLGLSCIEPVLQDAAEENPAWLEKMDAVLADVPCSGLGVIRKKPDVRYKSLEQLETLPEIQKKILENVSRYVRPGGVLVYSTCTVLRRENEDAAEDFLKNHPEFFPEPIPTPEGLPLPNAGLLTLLPCEHDSDGFFICRLRKRP
jgi:16S rRNA (cytosine967-C5)-methyltransferase